MTLRVGNPLRRRKKATKGDPYKMIPIPPCSVVRLSASDRSAPGFRGNQGRIFRVGYYGKADGLDCIWLVNDQGEYERTTGHDDLFRYFDVIIISDKTDLYGKAGHKFPPIRQPEKLVRATKAGKKKIRKKGTA